VQTWVLFKPLLTGGRSVYGELRNEQNNINALIGFLPFPIFCYSKGNRRSLLATQPSCNPLGTHRGYPERRVTKCDYAEQAGWHRLLCPKWRGLFVVSARHVVEQSYDLHARVECLNVKSGKKEVIILKLPRARWIFHTINGDKDTHYVDVAAMRIRWIKERTIKHFTYELPDSESKDRNQLPTEDPSPPRKILVFGFPLDIGFQLLEQRPFGRAGIISMRTGKKFLKMKIGKANKFAEERCFVIDAEAFPGNSGSPVLTQTSLTDPKLQLLGLLSASDQSMDFGVVEPVSRIREVLDQAKKQKDEDIEYWSLIKK